MKNITEMALVNGNLSGVYLTMKDYEKALSAAYKDLELSKLLITKQRNVPNPSMGIAFAYGYIGAVFFAKASYDSALFYYQKSLQIHRDLNHKNGVASMLVDIASFYSHNKNYQQAQICALEALEISLNLSSNQLILSHF